MTLLGGTGKHLGNAIAVPRSVAQLVRGVVEVHINSEQEENGEVELQKYLDMLAVAITRIKDNYKGRIKDNKGKLTPKGGLIKKGEDLIAEILKFGGSEILIAKDNSVFNEYVESMKILVIAIIKEIELFPDFTIIHKEKFLPKAVEDLETKRATIRKLLKKVESFCTEIDKLCEALCKKGNTGVTPSDVCERKQEGVASILEGATCTGLVKPTRSKKLGKVETRVANIESALGKGLKPDKSEIETMLANLNSMNNLSEEDSFRRDALLRRIQEIPTRTEGNSHERKVIAQKTHNTTEINLVFSENEGRILSIWRYILSEQGIYRKLSSTSSNGYQTNWDGTFVIGTLRPFLSNIFHLIFQQKKVDFDNMSWYEIVELYESLVVNISPHKKILINALRKYKEKGGFKSLLEGLLSAIKEVGELACFTTPSQHNLVNVQNSLRQIIERFYPE